MKTNFYADGSTYDPALDIAKERSAFHQGIRADKEALVEARRLRKSNPYLIGFKIGRLTFCEARPRRVGRAGRFVLCRCDCGNTKELRVVDVINARGTRSCGCWRPLSSRKNSLRHGHRKHPLYSVYNEMVRRCHFAHHKAYGWYGGRGIVVCNRWLRSFEDFVTDMGPRPDGTSIERKNNDGPYSPENCCWATPVEQRRNQRGVNWYVIGGEKLLLTDLAKLYGVNFSTLQYRLAKGLDVLTALTLPIGSGTKLSVAIAGGQ